MHTLIIASPSTLAAGRHDMTCALLSFSQNNQWTALMLATRKGHLRIVKLLLDHGADPNAQNDVSR